MKAYLLKLSLFIGLALLPLCMLEGLMRRPQADHLSAKRAFLDENRNTCETIILGSSYALTGLNPEWIGEQCLNLSNASQPYYYDYHILSKYAPRMPALQTVILPLSYPMFFVKPEKRQDNLYHIYLDLPPCSGKKTIESYSVVLALGLKNAFDQWRTGEDFYVNRGWVGNTSTFDGSDEKLQLRLNVMHSFMAPENFDENVRIFRQIVETCKQRNLRLVLYLSPMLEAYERALADDQPYRDKYDRLMAELAKDKSLEIYDLNNREVFGPACFRDPDHLNVRGAKILSEMIRSILANRPDTSVVRLLSQNHDLLAQPKITLFKNSN